MAPLSTTRARRFSVTAALAVAALALSACGSGSSTPEAPKVAAKPSFEAGTTMAKISAALMRLDEAKVPFISILTDPTTGGVTASFAMLGDLNISEPGALIGFAGPRVIEQTIRQKLPEGFQRAEFLVKHGMLDAVVPRHEMKAWVATALEFFCGPVERAA